jgi:hypothetical protein
VKKKGDNAMNIISEIVGWILLIILTLVASFLAFYYVNENTFPKGEITESQGKWWVVLLLLTLSAAIVSKILFINNIWHAIGIWVLSGSALHAAFVYVLKQYFGPPKIEKLKAKSNIRGLIKALRHEKNSVREGAAEALAQIGNKLAVEPLCKALKAYGDDKVIEALGKFGDVRAIGPLTEKLHECNSNVTAYYGGHHSPLDAALASATRATDALYKIGNVQAASAILNELGDLEERISSLNNIQKYDLAWAWKQRAVMLETLSKFGVSIIDILVEVLPRNDKSADRFMRQAAAGVLTKLEWQPSNNERGAWYWAARRNWKKCLEIGEAAIKPLEAALREVPSAFYYEEQEPDPTARDSYYEGVRVTHRSEDNPSYTELTETLKKIRNGK